MAERSYTVKYLMPMGVGSEFGVKEQDMAKGMDTVGKQGQWLTTSEYGMAVFNSLKGQGFDVTDVKDAPVFSQRQGGKLTYWVPIARFWQHTHPVGYKIHYMPLQVEVAQPSAEERQEKLQVELEKRKAELATKLEEAKANLEMQKIQAEINKVNAEATAA